MHSLKELAGMIAEAIDERREGAVGCFNIRPKHVNHCGGTVYGSAIAYVLDILAHTGLAVRQELARSVKYLICKDSELYKMPKEEMAWRIMQTVIEVEEKAWERSRDAEHVTRIDSKPHKMPEEKTPQRIIQAVIET